MRPQVKTMLMVTEALVKCGAREELGFKGILSSILKKLSGRIVGRAGDELVDGIFKYLDPLISEKLKEISSVYKNFFCRTTRISIRLCDCFYKRFLPQRLISQII